MKNIGVSKYNKRRWKDPVYRRKMCKILKNNNKIFWNGCNGRKNRKIIAKRAKDNWKSKKYRKKMLKVLHSNKRAKAIRKSLANFKLDTRAVLQRRKRQIKSQKLKWLDQSWAKKRLKAYRTKEHREKLSLANKFTWTKAKCAEHSKLMKKVGKKISKTNRRNYATGKRLPSKTNRENFEAGFVNSKKGGRFYSKSSWERKIAKLLDKDQTVISFIYEPFPICYKFEGRKCSYFPDFLIVLKKKKKVILELKGWSDIKTNYKKRALKRYCKKKH